MIRSLLILASVLSANPESSVEAKLHVASSVPEF